METNSETTTLRANLMVSFLLDVISLSIYYILDRLAYKDK